MSRIRVLVVDDSAYNRQTIAAMLESDPTLEVVGRAADGEEALTMLFQLAPDVVTLDLEMPKMDGFQFLRLVMAQRPTPIIVVSGLASRENVFKALELGALDFVAKPSGKPLAELRGIETELKKKLQLVTQLRMLSLRKRPSTTATATGATPMVSAVPGGLLPERLVMIGASTGGPPAITQLLVGLERSLPVSILITQHMPARFTTTFAERLARTTGWRVEEAKGGEQLLTGVVLVAPGGFSLAVRKVGAALFAEVVTAEPDELFSPSVDRMFTTGAAAAGERAIAVVLTGMGSDGVRGARAVRAVGGRVYAESVDSAVVFGMPQEAITAGVVDETLPLGLLPAALARDIRGKLLDPKVRG